jgi:hypothetical protein
VAQNSGFCPVLASPFQTPLVLFNSILGYFHAYFFGLSPGILAKSKPLLMIWTQIFKNHYFALSEKSKKKWEMVLCGTSETLLITKKNQEFHLILSYYAPVMDKIRFCL